MTGQAAAILGGGPSLPADLERLPRDCVLISVNHHALRLCRPDYMVYLDDPRAIPELAEAIDVFQGIKVSPMPSSDVILPKGEYWEGGFSSALATWFALWREYGPVILCGMDCYQGAQKYFYDRTGFQHPVFDFPLENHLRSWRLAFRHCPHPEAIRAMSGPLIEVFGHYEPA